MVINMLRIVIHMIIVILMMIVTVMVLAEFEFEFVDGLIVIVLLRARRDSGTSRAFLSIVIYSYFSYLSFITSRAFL